MFPPAAWLLLPAEEAKADPGELGLVLLLRDVPYSLEFPQNEPIEIKLLNNILNQIDHGAFWICVSPFLNVNVLWEFQTVRDLATLNATNAPGCCVTPHDSDKISFNEKFGI